MPDELDKPVVPGEPEVEKPAAEPDIEVEIDESDPLYKKPDWKTDPVQNAEDENDKDYGTAVKKRIGKLRASLTEAAKQRDKAARERDETATLARAQMAKIAELERQLAVGTASYIERQADAEDANSKLAEQALRQALLAGDPDAIAKANRDIAAAQSKLAQFRSAVEFRKAQLQQPAPVQQQPQYQTPAQTAQTSTSDPQLKAWQDANPWFNSDEEMTQAAFEVHDELASSGVRVGSPVYYRKIDEAIRSKFSDYFGEDEPTKPAVGAKPTLAPTTRSAVPSQQANKQSPNKVKLTASQAAMAKRLGMTPEQYAKSLVQLRNEGVQV